MFGKDRRDDASTRALRPDTAHGTSSDADVTSRMAGTAPRHAATDRDGDGVADRDQTVVHPRTVDRDGDGVPDRGIAGSRGSRLDRDGDGDVDRFDALPTKRRDAHAVLEERGVRPAKTSTAAVFALVFGLSALFCGLTGILAPAAVLFGLIGLVLGLVGRRKGRLPGITGRSVATGGLVTAVLGLLLGIAVIAGLAVYVNEEGLDGLQDRIDNARDELPTGSDVVDQVPGS